jgi:two-component system cell cycle sensor histidine kinase/response regulator CckA
VRLAVTDTGVGMGPEVLARIFEPFFTTKERDKGTGLGLATVYGIVQQGNGRVAVDSVPERGACFEVYLPQTTDVPEPVLPDAATLAPAVGTELILLVEDEESVRLAAQEVLENRGYRVLPAADGTAALRLVAAQRERLDLLVTDVVIPGMSGVQLASRLSEAQPGLRVLYMSGYPADAVDDLRRLGPSSFLQKPFPPAPFLRAVRAALDRAPGGDGAAAAGAAGAGGGGGEVGG